MRQCFERARAVTPDLAGEVVVWFAIASDGTVPSARVKSTTIADSSVGECVATEFKSLQFPPPVGGGTTIDGYPIRFP